MKFKLVGSNRQTGARVTMEVEAASRAMAERKGEQAGIEVLHLEQVIEETDFEGATHTQRVTHRGEFPDADHRTARRIGLLVVLAAVVAVAVTFWDSIRALIHR